MESMARQRVAITVTGRVQGVGFRYSARQKAVELNLAGFVRNLYDGSVDLEVEGRNEDVQSFIAWCRIGPVRAKVDSVDFSYLPLFGYTNFKIR